MSSSELTPEQKQHQEILNDPVLRSIVASRRPPKLEQKDPSKLYPNAISPYYTDKHALFIKPTLDEMLVDREPRCFPYKKFPAIQPATLYKLVTQAFQYLIDNFDDRDKTYAILREEVEVCKEHNGINIYFKKAMLNVCLDPTFRAEKISESDRGIGLESSIPKIRPPVWKNKILDFIEDEQRSKFFEDKFNLSTEEVAEVYELIKDLPNVFAVVKYNYIRMFKGTEEQVNSMRELAKKQEDGTNL